MLNNLYIVTDSERKEALNRERRQRTELARQNRIFDDRIRKIGVDVKSLDFQIQEKKIKEEHERSIDDAFSQQLNTDSEIAHILSMEEKRKKKMLEDDVNQYRKMYQQRVYTRDFDLNDPDILKKQKPLRSDDSEDVGLPTGQKFAGEDLRKEERKKVMAEQEAAWLKQQMGEKMAREVEAKAADLAYQNAVIAQNERALRLELVERDCKKRLESANDRYNKLLAEGLSQKQRSNHHDEVQDNDAEIYNTMTSDLLTENPTASQSIYGPHRVIPYLYKGMSSKEIEGIRTTQLNQIMENKAKKEAERKRDLEWQNLTGKLSKMAIISDKDVKNKKRMVAVDNDKQNMILAEQQKERKRYYDKTVYTNELDENYFNKFNTTSR